MTAPARALPPRDATVQVPTPKLSIRCSSLPLIMRCAAAAQRPEILVHWTHPQAETGTDVHTHLRSLVETGRIEWDSIRDSETRALVALGQRMWRGGLRELFPAPVCEQELSAHVGPVLVTGHTDVQSGMVGTCRILDWKSGRLDSDYREQLVGYAALMMLNNYAIDRVETHIAWVRDETVENYTLTREQLPEWCERVEGLLDWNGVYEAGGHCGYCPRANECPGYTSTVRSSAAALLAIETSDLEATLATMPPAQVIDLVRKAKLVGGIAEKVRDAARGFVDRCGDIEADGARLTISTQRRRKVDTLSAWSVLQERLTDEELASCVEVRLSKLEAAVAKKAPPRGGAQAKRDLAAQLEGVNAVHFAETKTLTERRT